MTDWHFCPLPISRSQLINNMCISSSWFISTMINMINMYMNLFDKVYCSTSTVYQFPYIFHYVGSNNSFQNMKVCKSVWLKLFMFSLYLQDLWDEITELIRYDLACNKNMSKWFKVYNELHFIGLITFILLAETCPFHLHFWRNVKYLL